MIRELFHIGPLAISPFGVLMVAAFLSGYALLRAGLKRQGIGDEEDASAILLAAGVAGILGAKIYFALLYWDWRPLIERTGLVWYGAFIGGALAVIWVLRRRHLPFWPTVDAVVPALALGYGVGRIGCFLVGDDYGIPTKLPWGVAFPYGLPGPTTARFLRAEYDLEIPANFAPQDLVPVHPTQLYETLAGIGIALVALWIARRSSRAGLAGLIGLALLATERFLVEILRAKDDRFFGTLTLAQIISLVVLLALAALWFSWRQEGGRIKAN